MNGTASQAKRQCEPRPRAADSKQDHVSPPRFSAGFWMSDSR